ncbi:hypothetical protein EV174_004135 [Coemansia sp. RSA 2320]|nr:hypothetical protein EV174_004135 [Coemansia sp. RSA 2320]
MGVLRRAGGYGRGAGMHLSVPLKARNPEKAWDICMQKLQHEKRLVDGVVLRSEAVDLILLMADSLGLQTGRSAGGTGEHDVPAERNRRSLFGFRSAFIMRHLFTRFLHTVSDAQAVPVAPAVASGEIDVQDVDLKLGRQNNNDYQTILAMLTVGADPTMPCGNSPMPGGASLEELAADIMSAPVSRLVYLLFLAAAQDGITVPDQMVHKALRFMIATQDVAAARDILLLHYPDLALLIDPSARPRLQPSAKNALSEPASENCHALVDILLQLIMVGQDPQVIDSECYSAQPQAVVGYDQFEDLMRPRNDPSLAAKADSVHLWRAETAERIYRAHIVSGMAEVLSPDRSKSLAQQSSVVPLAQALVTLFCINCKAGNIEQATILYDTIDATLRSQKSTRRKLPSQSMKHAPQHEEIKPKHKMDTGLWAMCLKHVCEAQQLWLAIRVLGDFAADGWQPSEEMYEQCLDAMSDPSPEALTKAVKDIEKSVRAGGKAALNPRSSEPLVCALLRVRKPASPSMVSERIEQALRLSRLPTAEVPADGTPSSSSLDSALSVSDATARKIISAMVANQQISRARQLTELWSGARPGIVTSKSAAELILGLGSCGEYSQALELFANIQEAMDGEIDIEILCAVLRVYVYAGDYEEAVSVGKRVRAMIRESREAGTEAELPSHDVFNCLLKAYCEDSLVSDAMRVLEEMRSYSLHATPETYTLLMHMMSALRSYDGLKLVSALAHVDYNMVPSLEQSSYPLDSPALVTPPLPLGADFYNALMEAYGRVAEPVKALQVWEVMRLRGIRPNNLTATLLIDTCGWNERVHWDDDMEDRVGFVERDIPEDHVYSGMPLFHMHYLANTLEQLQETGLEFSMANYRHLLEALIRSGFLEDVFDMVIGKYEDVVQRAMWTDRAQVLLQPVGDAFFDGLMFIVRHMGKQKESGEEPVAKFMDYSIDIPLCQATVNTIYGMIGAVRRQCNTKEGAEPCDMPFVQRASPNLLKRLDLHEQRLDEFLRTKRPDLIPANQPSSCDAHKQQVVPGH